MHIILGIDGTLADDSARKRLLSTGPVLGVPNWDAFFNATEVLKDAPVAAAKPVIRRWQDLRYHLAFITTRPEALRDVTMRWLLEHFGIEADDANLLMRPPSGMLSAREFKAQQMQTLLAEYKAAGANDFVFVDADDDTFETFAAEGLVLRAPSCWAALTLPTPTTEDRP